MVRSEVVQFEEELKNEDDRNSIYLICRLRVRAAGGPLETHLSELPGDGALGVELPIFRRRPEKQQIYQ